MMSMKISLLLLSCLLITLKAETPNSGATPSPPINVTDITTVTSQPNLKGTESSTATAETQSSTATAETQSSIATAETQSSTATTETQPSTATIGTQSSIATAETQSSTATAETQYTTGKGTAVQTTQSTPTSSKTTGSTPETSLTVTTSKTSDQTISVTSTGMTTIKPGGRLTSSEMALTVVFGTALGVVVLGLIINTCTKRSWRSLPITHQRLYDSDDTVDIAPTDDTLVISGGLYDGTQMHPVEGDVTADQRFTIQPAQLRLEFLHDAQERTPGNP